jgi:hypothetical protein
MHKKIVLSAILALALAGVAQATLVGNWKMDDGSGTVAADSTKNARNGTLVGGATWTTGKFGGAVSLTGSSSQYVNLAIGPLIQSLTDKATFTIWTNWAGTDGAWTRIWDFGNGTGTGYMFLCANQGSATGNLRFAITTTSNGNEQITNHTAILPTGWHHVAVTFDHAATTAKLMLDGVTVGTNTATSLTPSSLGNTTQNYLGKSQWADPYFTGALDDFRIYDETLTEADIQMIMTGYSPLNGAAVAPVPNDKATDVIREVVLNWTAGDEGVTHNVYLGTNFDDVNTASTSSALLVSTGQTACSYDPPGRLDFGATYYWRVDEVNIADSKVLKGFVWSFTAEPYAYAVANVTATASSQSNTSSGAQNTVNSSGLTGDVASVDTKSMWLSGSVAPAWIKYDLGGVYKLHEMWVWNHNSSFESILGFGIMNATVEYSLDGTAWTTLGDFEFAQAPGEDNYQHNTTIAFNGVAAKFVRITSKGTWGGKPNGGGLSEVRFFNIPVTAREPAPATASTNIDPTTVALSWRAGREASSHKIYIGTDSNAVAASTTPAGTSSTADYTPTSLVFGTTYYWRVDEVNTAEALSTWAGSVWSFTTAGFKTVEDFEAYTDDEGNRVFDGWIDGWGTTDNGSQVGYTKAPFAEQTIRYGGKQSMPFAYSNSGGITKSEATYTFANTQDWTKSGIKTLVVFFHGALGNSSAQLYVKVNSTQVNYTGSTSSLAAPMWKQWNVDLSSLNAKAVKTLTIGVSGSGSGQLYFDDLRLYATAPAVPVASDPGTTNLMAYFPFESDAKDASGHGYTGTLNNITFVDSMTGFGKAAVFNGTTGYVDLGASFGTNLVKSLSSCTIATWVNYSGAGNVWQRVLDIGTGSTNYMFLTTENGSDFPRFAILATGGTEVSATSSQVMSIGWHHLAATVDGTGKTIAIYVDGTLGQGGVATTALPKDLGATTQNWVGRSQWTADPYLNGSVDDLRVYNRVLTAGEIRYLVGER